MNTMVQLFNATMHSITKGQMDKQMMPRADPTVCSTISLK